MRSAHLQSMPFRLVLILAVEVLHLHVFVERVVHILAAPDQQLQVCVHFLPCRLEVHIDTLHKIMHAALKQLSDRALDFRALQGDSLFGNASLPRPCIRDSVGVGRLMKETPLSFAQFEAYKATCMNEKEHRFPPICKSFTFSRSSLGASLKPILAFKVVYL